ncbi:MAG: right-handed parallel beta-helix repeat-containing protein [Kiritimatiellae bacterium]|nr:right-handed parallel beta-helix repeat-containing protein [Kiritimatiellia bacterium]
MKLSLACVGVLLALSVQAGGLSLTNEHVILDLDAAGWSTQLVERATGRVLANGRVPFVRVDVGQGAGISESLEPRGDQAWAWKTRGVEGEVVLGITPFVGGWTFEVKSVTVPNLKRLLVGCLRGVACSRYTSSSAQCASDDFSGIAERAYDLHPSGIFGRDVATIFDPKDAPLVGRRFGLAAGPRAALVKALQAMTVAAGFPHSAAGGAWACDSEQAKGSYLNASVTAASVDDWIDLARRGGFDVVHFRENWYACRGHYPVNTNDFPKGLADMKAAVDKIHAAGLRAGLHTLTGCIDPRDPWIHPACSHDLMAWTTYTLAAPLTETSTELRVNEEPIAKHDVTFTYHGSGNAIRIGDEIVQYTGVRRTKPYAFTGITRGAFGTAKAYHAKGEAADYLQQRYIAFYPKPDSQLAKDLAAAIGHVYRTCGFDQIYCDGAEGMMTPYAQAKMRNLILSECTRDGRPCLTEDSAGGSGPACWWFHSRVGAWDSTYWAPKRFHDFHVANMRRQLVRERDFREIQMGWWCPVTWSPHARPHCVDEMEYYACKNTALDASMSIAGVNVARQSMTFGTARQMTVLGWYERFRRAGAFRRDLTQAFAEPRAEFRLRQDPDGEWRVARVEARGHRVHSAAVARWQECFHDRPDNASLRVEALYAGEPHEGGNALTMIAAVTPDSLAVTGAPMRVTASVAREQDAEKGAVIAFSATNSSDSAVGAWAVAAQEYRPYRAIGSRRVVSFWVKGDGSGALLNVQVMTPREYGLCFSEHYVKLDFTGWRHMQMPFRETDAEEFCNHKWPYSGGYAEVFHRVINMNQVSAVKLYLNDVPPHGSATVRVTDVRLVPMCANDIPVGAVLAVNGQRLPIPFALRSGEFAELENGFWTHLDKFRTPLARVPAQMPQLREGTNDLMLIAAPNSRAEVTLFALGKKRPALKDLALLTSEKRALLDYEPAEPCFFAPDAGFADLPPLVARPGMRAEPTFTVVGPIGEYEMTIADETRRFPAVAAGKTWRCPSGTFRPFSGRASVRVREVGTPAARPRTPTALFEWQPRFDSGARFEFVKRYVGIEPTAPKASEIVLQPYTELEAPYVVPHGGNADEPLVIRGADPQHPAVLSAGRRLTGWQVGADGVWRLFLPEVKSGTWNFSQLYVNGARRFRPHLPQTGFFSTVSNAFAEAHAIGGFAYRAGDLDPNWTNHDDLEIQILHTWSVSRVRVGEIDTASQTIRFAAPRARNAYHCDFKNRRYRVENVKEAFGRPGEWYLDRPTGMLSYTPLAGENPQTAEVVAPRLDCVAKVAGTSQTRLRHVIFRDVVFAHAGWTTPREGSFAVQSAYNIPAAVEVGEAEAVRFDRCGFYHTGAYALAFEKGTRDCAVTHSIMRDLGGGGVLIGPFGTDAEAPPDGRGNIRVENCRITAGGRIFPAAVGVLIGRSSHNRVLHNEIDHLYYTGVSVGWNWDEKRPSRAHHNEIAFNRIHDIGQGLLSDMGLIYLLGRAPGTSVHDNYLRDIRTAQYGGTGIYPDEGSSELEIYNNYVLNTVRSYHQNYGETNRVYNNIFVNGREMQYDWRPRLNYNGTTTFFDRNIVVWKSGKLASRGTPFGMTPQMREVYRKWDPPAWGGLSASSNVYCSVGAGPVLFGALPLKAWQEKGMESGSVAADPLFAGDVWAGDCTLRPDSPALVRGFRPLDLSRMGIEDVGELPSMPTWPCPTCY